MISAKKNTELFTYEQYQTWDDDQRWELIDGVPYLMAAPSRKHQDISMALIRDIAAYLKEKDCCKVYHAPFDIRLGGKFVNNLQALETTPDSQIYTVVQPDISVFCDLSKLDDKGGLGAPTFIIEILSPSTANKDLSTKLLLYQRFGVKEYWIVCPNTEIIQVFLLEETGLYRELRKYTKDETIVVNTLPELQIILSEIFVE